MGIFLPESAPFFLFCCFFFIELHTLISSLIPLPESADVFLSLLESRDVLKTDGQRSKSNLDKALQSQKFPGGILLVHGTKRHGTWQSERETSDIKAVRKSKVNSKKSPLREKSNFCTEKQENKTFS
jgi:hypothetical protein